MILLDRDSVSLRSSVLGDGFIWLVGNAPCDVLTVGGRDLAAVETIGIVTDRGPYDPLKVDVADALASEAGASIQLLYPVSANASPQRRETLRDYHDELQAVCSVPVESVLVESEDDELGDLTAATDAIDLVVVGDDGGRVHRSLFGRTGDHIAETTDAASIQVHPHESERPGILGRVLERIVF
jgi:nucleotide-binding universal stress UspA family protein